MQTVEPEPVGLESVPSEPEERGRRKVVGEGRDTAWAESWEDQRAEECPAADEVLHDCWGLNK